MFSTVLLQLILVIENVLDCFCIDAETRGVILKGGQKGGPDPVDSFAPPPPPPRSALARPPKKDICVAAPIDKL